MARKKSIKKNYIYNLLYQVIVIIIPIITIPYISRILGAEKIGIYSYTLSVSAYFVLLGSLGISLYGKREIAYVQNDKKKYSKLFWELLILKSFSVILSIVLFYFLFIYRINHFNMYYKILILELVANAIDISWFFQGLEEFKKIFIRNLIVKILSLVCIFLFVKSANDLNIYFIIYVLSLLACNFSLWFYLPKYILKPSFKKLDYLKHIKGTIILFIPQVAIQVYTVLDRTMIGYLIDDKSEVGFYTQGEKIIKLLLTIITAMGTVMLPRIASKFSEGDKKSIRIYIYKSFNLVYLLSFPMIFGLIAIADSFVPLFFGKGYDSVILIMQIISPVILFIGMSNVIGVQYLLPTKHQKEYTISVVFGAIINFVANWYLIPAYGALGAAVGTIFAESIVTITQLYCVREDLDIVAIFKSSVQYLISSAIMFCCCIMVGHFIKSNVESLFAQILIGAIVYISCLLIFKNSFVHELIDYGLYNVLRRKK